MKQHFIYVIGREEGPVKVGITSSLPARLSALQTGCHFKIDIHYARPCRSRESALEHEQCFHADNAEQRLAGEWFDVTAAYAAEEIDTGLDLELWYEEEGRREYIAAHLNLWPWAGEDGAHTNY